MQTMTPAALIHTLTTTPLPASVQIAPGCVVVDVPKYIETNISRLESTSPRLRALALRALQRLAEIITADAGQSPA